MQVAISRIIEAQLHSGKRTTRVTGFNAFSHEDDPAYILAEEPDSAYTGRLQHQTIKRGERYTRSSSYQTDRQIV